MSDGHTIERRLTLQLVAYWEKLRNSRPMPSENDINPEELGELWDYCFLVQVRDAARRDYHFSYLGGAIVEAYRGKLSEGDSGSLVTLHADKLSAGYGRVI